MVWNVLQDQTKLIRNYSTNVGKVWFVVQFIFRLLIVSVVGTQVYGDEVGQFKCDTNQPGCSNVCYNRFSPISHLRFWAFQLLFLSLPKFLLYGYIQFIKNEKKLLDEQRSKVQEEAGVEDDGLDSLGSNSGANGKTSFNKVLKKLEKKEKRYKIMNKHIKNRKIVDDKGHIEEVLWTPLVRAFYILHLILQMGIEVMFLYLNVLLQRNQTGKSGWAGFRVPERYDCRSKDHTKGYWGDESVNACGQNENVTCWVSRPWEKGIFVMYMAFFACLSIIISFIELIYFSTHVAYKSIKRRKEKRMDKYMLISTTKYGQSTGSMHYNPYQQKSFRDKLKTNGELRSRASSVMSNRLQNQNFSNSDEVFINRNNPPPPPPEVLNEVPDSQPNGIKHV